MCEYLVVEHGKDRRMLVQKKATNVTHAHALISTIPFGIIGLLGLTGSHKRCMHFILDTSKFISWFYHSILFINYYENEQQLEYINAKIYYEYG